MAEPKRHDRWFKPAGYTNKSKKCRKGHSLKDAFKIGRFWQCRTCKVEHQRNGRFGQECKRGHDRKTYTQKASHGWRCVKCERIKGDAYRKRQAEGALSDKSYRFADE